MATTLATGLSFSATQGAGGSTTVSGEAPAQKITFSCSTSFSNTYVANPVNMTGKYVMARIDTLPTVTGTELTVEIRDPSVSAESASLQLIKTASGHELRRRQINSAQVATTYNPATMVWMVIGHDDATNQVWYGYADSAGTITELGRFTLDASIPIAACMVRFFARSTADTDEIVEISNVNNPPPPINATIASNATAYRPGDTITLTVGGGTGGTVAQTAGTSVGTITKVNDTTYTCVAPYTLQGTTLTFTHTLAGDATPAEIAVIVSASEMQIMTASGMKPCYERGPIVV